MSDSFTSFPRKEAKPKLISLPVPPNSIHRRRKSSFAVMETREIRGESGSFTQKDKKEEELAIQAAISNFNQKVRRIESREIDLPKRDQNNETKSRELEESIIISRLHDEGSQPSHKGFNGNSDGTNQVSSHVGTSTNKLMNYTGGNLGANISTMSLNKSPSIGNTASVGEPDFDTLPEDALQSMLQASLQDKVALEQKVQRLDLKIRTLQRSILDKSKLTQVQRDDRSEYAEAKTTVKAIISPLKSGKRRAIDSKLVKEVLAESPVLANQSSLMWQQFDSLLNDSATVKPELRNSSFLSRVDNSSRLKTAKEITSNKVKKRDLIIKSSRENKPVNRTFTYHVATSVASEKSRGHSKYNKPTDQVRSFSINSTKKPSVKPFKLEGPKKAFKSFTNDDSYIFH